MIELWEKSVPLLYGKSFVCQPCSIMQLIDKIVSESLVNTGALQGEPKLDCLSADCMVLNMS